MPTQNTYRTLVAYLFACMLVIFVAGCGGGGGSGDQTGTTPTTPSTEIDIKAISGPIVAIRVGEVAMLDDSRSFTNSTEALSYSWSFSHKPAGSNAELQGATTATPSFVADVRGVYMIQLVVSAEGISSQRAITTVVVTNSNERRTGRFNHLGLSSNCVNCHNGVNLRVNNKLLFPKPPTHIASSNTCQTCHTPQGFNIIPFADHQEVFGNCSECHNGVIAIGKSDFHPATVVECDDCHNTTSFLNLAPDGSFDHSNITRACNGCHNGTVATGKHAGHTDTNTECGYCHTTVSFLNAYPDHTDPVVMGNGCDSCHGVSNGQGGLIAVGQSVGHPVTDVSLDCDACHSILSFKMPGGLFNHSLLDATVQSCESCHNANTSINARAATPTTTHLNATADCGVCHNTESFIPAFNFDHTDIVDNCAASGCHTGLPGEASGKPLSTLFYAHMPTTEDCSACHTPGTFSTGTFVHTGPSFVGSCDSCHNNVISVGKLLNHIPTDPLLDCDACHDTTTFTGTTFDHTSTDTSNCLTCHDGNISKGKSFGHVATDLNCSSCHAVDISFTTFAGTFDHDTNIVGNDCASCHNTGIALPKKVNHIPAQTECSECHMDTSTGGFVSSTFMANVHPGIISGCEGCHTSKFLPTANSNPNIIKASSHLPTDQDCDVCHTNASFMAPTNFAHAGITGNCASCHDGNHVIPAGALGKADDPTPPHPATTQDCGVCHNTASFADAIFDHTGRVNNCAECHGDNGTGAVTKKNIGHVPTTQDCSVCHVTGTFIPAVFDHTGIVNNCAQCHGDNATAAVTKKNSGHVSTTQDCSLCHNTTAFAGARFDHTGITNNCASCHDGATARGKTPPPNHVPTTGDCSDCHQTTSFRPATFDHVGIVDNCRSCHDGAFAIGKSSTHVPTNQDCGVCHNTRTFIGAGFNHTGIVDNCASCHDGSTAPGKHNAHIATALDCSSCHTTATFVGGTWTHDASSVGNCDQCHSTDGGARSKPTGHLSTNVQCDACHSTNGWAPSIFSHDPRGDYPGDHRRDPLCSGCHGNSIVSPFVYDWSQYAPDCAACHANDFDTKDDHIGGKSGTVEQNKNCGASGCHKVSDSNFD